MAHNRATLQECDDVILVAYARSGNRDAFGELVRRNQSWVRNLFRTLLTQSEYADDLAQQAFLLAWKDLAKLREAKMFHGWLKRLSVNVFLKHRRKQDPLRQASDLINQATGRDKVSVKIDLHKALASLSTAQQQCVVLAYSAQLSHSDIAKILDMPLGTVKSHIRRATQSLQLELAAYANTGGSTGD